MAEMALSRRARQLLFAILLLSTAERVTPALAAGILREHLRLASSEFGLLAGMSAFTFGLAQFPGGYLADAHGALRVVRYAALSSAAFAILFILAPSYPIALVGRGGFGLSDSLVLIGMMRLAVSTDRAGTVLGLANVSSSVGAAMLGAAVGVVLDSQWRGAVWHGLRLYPESAYGLVPAVLGAGSVIAVIGLLLARETHGEQFSAPLVADASA